MRSSEEADTRRSFQGITDECAWERKFHYASDGTEIAYDVMGDPDLPTLLLCDGIGCAGFIWKYLCKSWEGKYRVIHPYYRGHGASSTPSSFKSLSIAHLAADYHDILRAEGVAEFVTLGHSMGVQVSLELVRQFPNGCSGMVLICGSYGRPLDTFHGIGILNYVVPLLKHGTRFIPKIGSRIWRTALQNKLSWYVATLTEVNPAMARKQDIMPYMDHLATIEPDMFFSMLALAGQHTAESALQDIEIPSLIIAGSQDGFTPPWLSEKMSALLPDSELCVIQGGSHVAPLEAPGTVTASIQQHLNRSFADSKLTT